MVAVVDALISRNTPMGIGTTQQHTPTIQDQSPMVSLAVPTYDRATRGAEPRRPRPGKGRRPASRGPAGYPGGPEIE